MSTLPGSVFVGRQREMAELKSALEDALSGQGRLVMLVGEPGIGKTRTSQELAAIATLRGAQALWGRCHSTEGAPPYWPWLQVIRSYVQGHDPEQLGFQMGAGAADIAEVVPELRERLPDLEPPPALEPQQARFRLFDSTTRFLKQACKFQPLMLVLDNLHWADRPSLLLLEFLAQEMAESRLLLVGTYRDTELTRHRPLTQTLGELAREPVFRRLPLRGLSEEEVGHFIQVSASFAPPHELVRAVHTQTEGNPLFMAEVVRLLAQEGELTPQRRGDIGAGLKPAPTRWDILIPAGVREVIGRRLDRLTESCNQVLAVASVIGREFELGLLGRLMDQLSSDELLEAVEEAVAARLVEEVPSAVGRYQFTHVLVQDTLAQELSAARRARLHQRIAEALEELYGARVEAHAAELTYHFAQAIVAGNTEKLIRYSLLAGERALAAYGWEEALAHFERGLAAKEGLPMDAERAALFFGLARAQLAASERFRAETIQEPVGNLKRAFDYYVDAGDVDRAVAVAEHPVRAALGVAIGEAELIGRALALVPPDSHQAGRLLSAYGLILYQESGNYEDTQEAFGRALDIARREQDAALEMRTLANAADVDFFHLRWQESLVKGQQAIKPGRSVGDLRAEATARYHMGRVLDHMGDPERAQQQAAALLAQAERLRGRGFLGEACYISGLLSYYRGDWQAARDFFDRGVAATPQNPPVLCARTVLEYQLGEVSQGRDHLERLLDATHRSAMGTGFA